MSKLLVSFIVGAILGVIFAYVYNEVINVNVKDEERRYVHTGSYALATAVQFVFLAIFGFLLRERFTL